ncbi:MAG: HD domain-containing protein [Planctomycetota bacterium]|nr:HD domain-containing protein [Planctomycetota bacterium]
MYETVIAPGRVLLVGSDESVERLKAILLAQSSSCVVVGSVIDAMRCLRQEPTFDLVVLIPQLTPDACLELCRHIKFDQRSRFISVTCILSEQLSDRKVDFYDAGADDCIRTVTSDDKLTLRLMKAIRMKQATDSLEDSELVIKTLANAVEGKDHYTCGHIERVSAYAVEIGRRVNVNDEGLTALKIGGIVHDIGKIGIPDQILNKPGKLTDDEMAIMKRHPVIGYDILKPSRTFRNVLPMVRWHHEKPNGGGYPDGLKSDGIPLSASITAVADCFDALVTDRPYRPAFSLPKCKEILGDCAQKGDLDAAIVQVLFTILEERAMPELPGVAA